MTQRRFFRHQQMEQPEKNINIKQWLMEKVSGTTSWTAGWMRSINVKLFGETEDSASDTTDEEMTSNTQLVMTRQRKKRYEY